MSAPDFLTQIQEAKSDLYLVCLLSQIYPDDEMPLLIAALIRAQELILMQKGVEL